MVAHLVVLFSPPPLGRRDDGASAGEGFETRLSVNRFHRALPIFTTMTPLLRDSSIVVLHFAVSLVAALIVTATGAVFAAEHWPQVVDLDIGESCLVATQRGAVRVELLSVKERSEPDYFVVLNSRRTTLASAEVELDIGGLRSRVVGRPYQLPTVINGVRLYLEATQASGAEAHYAAIADLKKAVRLSVLDAAEPWGPTNLVFPIDNYRWRSSTYNNTWSGLVPYNRLYYHRGEDLGAIPDQLPVAAMFSGTVVRTPRTQGRPIGSNHVAIEGPAGVVALYGHMNYEHIDPAIVMGAKIQAGQLLGRTGSTWNGARNQKNDPHLHISLHRPLADAAADVPFPIRSSAFPMLVAAYFRKYPDPVLAIAGGYRFVTPGETLELDATRSIARPGEEIAGYEWRLHDGTRVAGPETRLRFDAPGLYSEELIVRTKNGGEDRDFLQVRVYDPKRPVGEIGWGWFFHSPVRGVRPKHACCFGIV